MEAIILGNPFIEDLGTVTPIIVPSYEAEEAVIELTTGYNPYVIGSGGTSDSYWIRTGSNILRPISTSDKIVVGGTSFLGTESLRVVGGINITRLTIGGESTYITSVRDEDTLVSNDEHAIPTQQSVKAYIDNLSISGLQPGDDISLLTNDIPYIVNETDPIFVASVAHTITGTHISNWNAAYGWGNHALMGYLTTETDPVFVASDVYGITSTDISNWNDAYSQEHVHSNFSLLQSIVASGDGASALFNDGTYKIVSSVIGGSDSNVQYNNSGVLGGDSTFFFNSTTKLLSVQDLSSDSITLGSTGVTITVDGSDNLVFTDSISGSNTLASLIGGATNYWTSTTGGIYYTTKVGINNASTLTEALTVTGNIVATDFNSSYIRYKNSNILIGPNAGDNETGNYLLYIAESNTATPLIYGDFLNQEIKFNADTYINTVKRLAFGDSLVSIRRDSSDNLEFRDLNANSGNPILLSDFLIGDLSLYALKSDFISYSSVESISAANLVTWGKASYIVTGGTGTNFLGDDGVYHAGGSGGVTPTDGLFKFDLGTVVYRPYVDETEAGSSAGKFLFSLPTTFSNNLLIYDGFLTASSFTTDTSLTGFNGISINSSSSVDGISINNTDIGNGLFVNNSSTGVGVYIQNASSGYGLQVVNNGGLGNVFANASSGSGNVLTIWEENGIGISIETLGIATGTPLQILKGVTNVFNIDYNGVLTNTKIVSGDGAHVLSSGNNIAVYGDSISGFGIIGECIDGPGVSGYSTNNYGVYGNSTNSNAIFGQSLASGIGVYGTSIDGYGLYGQSTSTIGIYGVSSSGYGILGVSSTNVGISGQSTDNTAIQGISTNGIGVFGQSVNSVSGVFDNSLGSTSNIVEAQINGVNKFSVNKDGKVDYIAGTSSTFVRVPGILKDFYTDVSTSGTSETDLYSYTVPSNVLASDGDKLSAYITVDSSTTTGLLNFYFAGTSISIGSLTAITGRTIIEAELIRTSSSTLRGSIKTLHVLNNYIFDLTSKNWTIDNILKITGIASVGVFTAKFGYIEYKPAAIN